ncbi:MAG TPA: hypothetical protein VIU64_17500 [Polyangia bacterium]
MLTRAQADAIREHVALGEHVRRLIGLARADLYHGPIRGALDDEERAEWPGFFTACEMIAAELPRSDLYIDLDVDEVIGESEPRWHGPECGCAEDPEVACYHPDVVLHVDRSTVVRALVGSELARHV